MHKRLRYALFSALMCGSIPAAFGDTGTGTESAAAVSAAPSAPSATLGALAEAQSKVALLKAQLEIAKLNAEIAKAKAGKLDSGNTPANAGYPAVASNFPMAASPAPVEPSATSMPRVLGISGTNDHLTATLALPNGGTLAVRPGQNLPPYGRVTSITDHGVSIVHAGKVEPLPFVSAISSGSSGQGGSFGAAPSIPSPSAGFANPLDSAPVYGPPPIPSGSLPPKSAMPGA